MFGFLKRRRRARLRSLPFPEQWQAILERDSALWRRLPDNDRAELGGHINVFLAEKRFEGCGGLKVTDEMRLLVASQACILLLHRATDYFPTVSSILLYPTAYWVKKVEHDERGIVTESEDVNIGEAWSRDLVVLSWEDALAGAREEYDAPNVIIHEFAHALDDEDGEANGAPLLPTREMRTRWAQVFQRAYDSLREAAEAGKSTLLDGYGAEDPAEFFAVATECFFQNPADLRAEHPELYATLRKFYNCDPADWRPR